MPRPAWVNDPLIACLERRGCRNLIDAVAFCPGGPYVTAAAACKTVPFDLETQRIHSEHTIAHLGQALSDPGVVSEDALPASVGQTALGDIGLLRTRDGP